MNNGRCEYSEREVFNKGNKAIPSSLGSGRNDDSGEFCEYKVLSSYEYCQYCK